MIGRDEFTAQVCIGHRERGLERVGDRIASVESNARGYSIKKNKSHGKAIVNYVGEIKNLGLNTYNSFLCGSPTRCNSIY